MFAMSSDNPPQPGQTFTFPIYN